MSPETVSAERSDYLTIVDKLRILLILIRLPVAISWALLMKPFSPYGRAKSWKRLAADTYMYTTLTNMTQKEVRNYYPSSLAVYDALVARMGLPRTIDELGDDARLLWVGPKRADRVLLFFHGGGFVIGLPQPGSWYWAKVQDSLRKRGKPTALAMLNYTLIPDRPFPTQLNQAVLAVKHLLASGVAPGNIQLVGDSAGAALIHGIFSHILHPLEGIPKLALSAPFGGAVMVSTWAKLTNDENNCLHTNNGRGDWLNGDTCGYWGSLCMRDVPPAVAPYVEGNSAPKGWLAGIDKLVKRMLLTIGEVEVLRDTIIAYGEEVKRHHPNATVILQENGTHNDPYTDMITGTRDAANLSPLIIDWLDEGFPTFEASAKL